MYCESDKKLLEKKGDFMQSETRLIKVIILLSFSLFVMQNIYAEIRQMEPVILIGTDLPDVYDVPIDQIQLFVNRDDLWVQIPMQIDERSTAGSLYEDDDGLWDENDELVFQPQDGGASVLASNWIEDTESQSNSRYKIAVNDPAENDYTFVYLYYSSTIEDTVSTSYISYNDEEDAIITEDYKIGFDDQKLFWDEFRFKEGIDFSNDLMDREKMRINGTVWPFPEYTLSENDFSPIDYWVKSGKIRVMRKVQNEVSVYGITQTTEAEKHFYRSFLQVPDLTISVDESAGVTMIRRSYDLSSESVGAIISTSNNEFILVDGNPDPNVQTDIELSEMSHYWIKMDFENKSLVTVSDFSGISDDFLLYYYDNSSGGTNDGTDDTGDMASYGDTGMRFNNPNAGEHIIKTNIYASIENDLSGITCQSYFDNSFECEINEEVYVPVGISNDDVCLSSNISLSNYPNPFNPSTTIKFYLPTNSFVDLSIFNIKGQKIKQLIKEETPKGIKSVVWNGKDETGNFVSSGIYLYQIQTDQDQVSIKRMILMK